MKNLFLLFALFCMGFLQAQPNEYYTVPIPFSNSNQGYGASMAGADNGHVYIAGRSGPVYKFNGLAVNLIDTVGLSALNNFDIDELNGKLYLAKENGLYVYENNTWQSFTTQNSALPANKVYCVKATETRIVLGTDSGLVVKDNGGWQVYNTSNSAIISNIVRAVDVLDNGNIIVGTLGGLSIYNGNSWTNFDSTNSPLKNNLVSYVKACQNNTFWVSTKYEADTVDIYPGYYLYKNGQFLSLADLDESCLHRSVVSSNIGKHFMIDGMGNLLVNLNSGYFKKFLHPDNGNIKEQALKFSLSGTNSAGLGEYSNYGFDCFIAGGALRVVFDSCFTSPYVADSLLLDRQYGVLDINNIASTVRVNGTLFSADDPFAINKSPKVGCEYVNRQGALWLGGVDNNGYLRGAAPTYGPNSDYFAGPLDTVTALTDGATMRKFSKVWKINKSMIMDFQLNYQNGIAFIHPDILSWPGNGTGNQAKKLAPFIDVNNNGLYEPLLGDYPELTGDEMLYWIFNDKGGVHAETGCLPLGVEIHATAYAYVCDDIAPGSNDEALNNTVFYKYTIHNRGTYTFNDFYTAWWQDPDLGRFNDDYIGCDTMRNTAFVYNGINNDGGIYGYGLNPPMQSYVQLDGPLAQENDGRDNDHDGVIDEVGEKILFSNFMYYNNDFSVTGNPENCQHTYSYMRSRWKDNIAIVNNGNGYGNGIPVKHMFPSVPYSGEGWSEQTVGNTPADRRFIISSGPIQLLPQDKLNVEYAIVFSHYATAPNGLNTSIALNNAYVDNVRQWYAGQSFPSCYDPTTLDETEVGNDKLLVYPNPANTLVNISVGNSTELLDFCVADMAGKMLLCGKGNTIDIAGLASGMYLLYVEGQKGRFYSKIVKQ